MVIMTPRVVDISHWEKVDSFKAAANSGIWGIIAKCTQGTSYKDPTYDTYIKDARVAGMLVGAYHFNDATDPKDQVDFFLQHSNLQSDMLAALDFEDYKSNMTVFGMVEWLRYFEEKMGYKAVLYSGNRIKDNIHLLNSTDKTYVVEHRLWLAHYTDKLILPQGFKSVWLHQFTGDGVGPVPHTIPGIRNPGGAGLDLNAYDGTREQLAAEWVTKTTLLPSSQKDQSTIGHHTPNERVPDILVPDEIPDKLVPGNKPVLVPGVPGVLPSEPITTPSILQEFLTGIKHWWG